MCLNKFIVTLFSAVLLIAHLSNSINAYAGETVDQDNLTPYVLLTESENGNIDIFTNELTTQGNIRAKGFVNIYASTKNINGTLENGTESFSPDNLFDLFERNDNIQTHQTINYYSDTNVKEAICSDFCNFYCSNIKISADILSDNNIGFYCNSLQSNDLHFLSSKNGNITINASNFDYQGIIYAPNGTVTINANLINYKGIIISNNIVMNANYIKLTESVEVFDLCDKYCNDLNEQNYLIQQYENIKAKIKAYEDISKDTLEDISTNTYTETLSNLYDEYESLHDELQERNMFMKSDEINKLFLSDKI
ncbi:MAG: hypothetical protein K2F81_05960 [Ruminococcus sp.]|nr:hypothetical protein [Ruminococcus sp.]